jgi:hypothetical protein
MFYPPTSLQSEGTKSFIALAVVTYGFFILSMHFTVSIHSSDVPSSISPCGMCRQVIREFCALDMPILLVPGDYPKPPGDESEGKPGVTAGGVKETSIGELLPDSFGPEHLELPRTGGGGCVFLDGQAMSDIYCQELTDFVRLRAATLVFTDRDPVYIRHSLVQYSVHAIQCPALFSLTGFPSNPILVPYTKHNAPALACSSYWLLLVSNDRNPHGLMYFASDHTIQCTSAHLPFVLLRVPTCF